MFKTNLKALNSYFAYAYNDFKRMMIIGSCICAGFYIMQIILAFIIIQINDGGASSNSGMLIAGTSTFLITFMIGFFLITSNGEIRNAFRFPINRPTYALGTLINIFIAPLAIICVASAFYVLETFTYAILSRLFENITFVNTVSIIGYLDGILPTYVTIVFALSVIYMLSMYFHRYKMPFILVLSLFIFVIIIIPDFRVGFMKTFTFGFEIKSILPFTLYMLGMSLVAHILAFFPLKIMEVK